MSKSFTEKNARKWMRRNADAYLEPTGEVNLTRLAEACAAEFDANQEGGPLDDEEHFIWEIAVEVADEVNSEADENE